jgi:hypothetical protein
MNKITPLLASLRSQDGFVSITARSLVKTPFSLTGCAKQTAGASFAPPEIKMKLIGNLTAWRMGSETFDELRS